LRPDSSADEVCAFSLTTLPLTLIVGLFTHDRTP
jgi:hypothetical protein